MGPESSWRNRQRQGNGHGGSGSRGDRLDWYGEGDYRSRSRSRVGIRTMHSRAWEAREVGCGRSPTHRRDRPFSCSRDLATQDRFAHRHSKGDAAGYSGYSGAVQKLEVVVAIGGGSENAPAVSTQVSAVFYITNFPNRLLYVNLTKGLEVFETM